MIVLFALAVGTLGPAPAGPELVPDDCIRVEQIRPAVPRKKPKPGLVHRRIFKADPKPVIEPCEEAEPRLPPSAILPPLEPEAPYSPMPLEVVEFPPLYAVPTVPDVPCDCGPSLLAGPPVFLPPPVSIPRFPVIFVLAPPVPEPSTWALMLGSVIASRLRFAARKREAK